MYQIGWVPREREGLQINCAAVSIFFIIYVWVRLCRLTTLIRHVEIYTVILTVTIKQIKESSFLQHPMISWVIYPREVVLNDLLSTILFETHEGMHANMDLLTDSAVNVVMNRMKKITPRFSNISAI